MPPKTKNQRRTPFSGKLKKQQLQNKNVKKRDKESRMDGSSFDILGREIEKVPALSDNFVRASGQTLTTKDFSHKQDPRNPKKLVSVFNKVSYVDIQEEKIKSMQPFKRLPKDCMEVKETDFEKCIDFPKRPVWDYDLSKEEVESREVESFNQWLNQIEEQYKENEISWFERNIEVWRQLWRVLEISDVVLIVMDIKNPMLHFPPSLYDYITNTLKKKIIGVFNKVDQVSEFTVFAWKKFFEEKFPNLQIATFSCYPRDPKLIDDTATYSLRNQVKRAKKRYYYAQGVKDLLTVVSKVANKPGVPLDWKAVISQYDEDNDLNTEQENDEDDDSDTGSMDGLDDEFSRILEITGKSIQPHQNYITLGLVGHPNVGKSSLINSIMQRTVVSASRTPGHTKHFQTVHISDHLRLCDSPGLVFPALIPKSIQILSGMYPIAQVQEPYSAIRFLAEHIPLEKILSLTPPLDTENIEQFQWTAWSICEEFAEQKGFHTAKAARPDVYRAANAILRLTTDGRILLSFKPPGFFNTTKYEKLRVQEADLITSEEENSDSEDEIPERENLLISRGRFSVFDSL